MDHVVIIGNGISGITAARHIRKKSDCRITVVSAESDYFFSRTALMYVYMGHMRFQDTQPYENWFWEKNKIELVNNYVEDVETNKKELKFKDNSILPYDKLILALGSKPNKFGWPGQECQGVQGLYSLQDLELMEKNTKSGVRQAVIVGGGLIGVEMAEMLITRGIHVTFLVREDRFWGNVLPKEEGELVAKHLIDHRVDLRLNTELKEIIGDNDGKVNQVITSNGEKLDCQFVGLTAGVSPNVGFLKSSKIELARGVLVNEFFETNIQDVFAIGDCAQFANPVEGRRPIEQVWYTGRMHGETVALNICGDKTAYNPGYWFNSAKFFDIEYQTYGTVLPELNENEETFYWEAGSGKVSVRFVYDKGTRKFIGLNVFGIRLRHEILDKWLKEQRTVEYILEHLRAANFDPEFYKKYEQEILNKFNEENKGAIQLKSKSSLIKQIFS